MWRFLRQDGSGVGEQLVYSNDTGDFVLTGTAAAPPQLIDPAHGTVTGQALIFNSRNDSVRVEGERTEDDDDDDFAEVSRQEPLA